MLARRGLVDLIRAAVLGSGAGTLRFIPRGAVVLLLVALIELLPRAIDAQNIVVVIVDDVGAEWFTSYGEQAGNPPTPAIESLAAQGVLFRSAWAEPVCSPSRISFYTGHHPIEHGAGHAIASEAGRAYVLDPATPNLANLLRDAGYRTAAVGKWHMATELGFTGPDLYDGTISETEGHPNLSGMQHFAGFLFGGLNYFDWQKTVNGITSRVTTYATTETANEAIAQLSGSEPYFLWVGFNAPHGVFHMPPAALLANPSIYSGSFLDQFRAMIEAMDTEFGRFLQQIDLTDTTVIFVGDNGSPGGFLQPPRLISHGKGTVYQEGVRVPLIVSGQAVPLSSRNLESVALVQATDLFATVLEIAGLDPPTGRDSVSVVPYLSDPGIASVRSTVYTEIFLPNGGPIDPATHDRAARGLRYKLVRRGIQPDELYDLELDPHERSPLDLSALTPDQDAAHDSLDLAIRIRALPEPRGSLPFALGALALLARRGRARSCCRTWDG